MHQGGGFADNLALAIDLWWQNTIAFQDRLRTGFLSRWKAASPRSYEFVRRRFGPRYDALPAYGSTVVVDGITMRIDARMSELDIRSLSAGHHTREERAVVTRALEPDDVVMELGGGIGMVAIACAKTIGSDRVFSFEANPRLEPLIRDNYALNNVQPTLSLCMLGPQRGRRDFHISRDFSRSSVYDPGQGETIQVPVESFNEMVAKIRPTLLILDIEGNEKELLEYADLSSIQKIVIELHPWIIGVFNCLTLRKHLLGIGFSEKERLGLNHLFVRQQA